MVKQIPAALLVILGVMLLAGPALAGEIEGHVFSDQLPDPAAPPPPFVPQDGIFDEGIDEPAMVAVLLTQIGIIGGPPAGPEDVLNQWFAFSDATGFYSFIGLPDDGIFQIDLPFQSDAAGFMANIVTGEIPGAKTAEPVPAPPLGIIAMPPTSTTVDIPLLPASAPCAAFTAPPDNIAMGGIFVDRNPGGQTGGNGIGSRGAFCTIGNQGLYGAAADGIEVVLQCLDAAGDPTGAPYTTIVGSSYTFVPTGETDPFLFEFDGWFMFLAKALADGESVRVSIDPTQPALAGLLPVSDTTVVRTLDLTPPGFEEPLPVIEFRFQPAFDLNGRLQLVDTQGITRGMPGVSLTLIDLVTNLVVTTTTTDEDGYYQFPDLFNSVYLVQVENTSSNPTPTGVRQIENVAPADLNFLFTGATCPDGLAPTITVPADIVVECASTSGTATSWAATATDNVTPAADILISYAPFEPGDTIPGGVHTITVEAVDWCGNTATGTFTITVQDTTPPEITGALLRTLLYPARNGLIGVGLSASATDVCDGAVDVVVTVFSDEDHGAAPFAPDATGTTVPDLRLRMERDIRGNGRVYVIRITATDRAGNTAVACRSSIVPLAPVGSYILGARAQAAAGEAACARVDPFAGVPAGFFELLRIGTPPEVPE